MLIDGVCEFDRPLLKSQSLSQLFFISLKAIIYFCVESAHNFFWFFSLSICLFVFLAHKKFAKTPTHSIFCKIASTFKNRILVAMRNFCRRVWFGTHFHFHCSTLQLCKPQQMPTHHYPPFGRSRCHWPPNSTHCVGRFSVFRVSSLFHRPMSLTSSKAGSFLSV